MKRDGLKGTCLAGALVSAAIAFAGGCSVPRLRPASALVSDLRPAGRTAIDPEVVGLWGLSEMLAPGGSAEQAEVARHRLDGLSHDGMWASLARAVFDDEHGDPRSAAQGYVSALRATAASMDSQAALVAWFAVRHLMQLRDSVANLFAEHRPTFDALLAQPGHIGWRAVADLEEWRAIEVYDKAERTGAEYDDDVVRRMGCARGIRVAGPFGHGVVPDAARSFAPEDAMPWPAAWPPDPVRGSVPRVLAVTQTRCLAVADEQVPEGVFYVETYFKTQGDRDLLVSVQGAVAVWIDGTRVLSRATNDWGSWQRFGAHVFVGEGRHRVLARTVTPGASVRLLNPDGTAAALETDGDPGPGFDVKPPTLLSDPNPIDAAVRAAAAGATVPLRSPIDAWLAAYAAHADQMDDVASTLIAPFAEPADAAGLALQMAATFATGDPAWSPDARSVRARALRDRALARDLHLWRARLAADLDAAEQHGLADAVEGLRTLVAEVPNEPEALEQLAQVFGRLGWRDAQQRALEDLTRRFPDDVGALHAYLDVLDDNGPAGDADTVAARIKDLEPDTDVAIDRALARHDYGVAIAELKRLASRRPDRKDIANRLADVLARSGKVGDAADQLGKALAKHPGDVQARFRLADREYASGDTGALRRALAAALQASASAEEIRAAIDLVEGKTDLEPFRQDGRAIIVAFQRWERAGHHLDGTAARVLDYSAIWVHDDGSSEMLEHEIQKIQSQEAIQAESETESPTGLVLHLRVIKPDGRVFEPEPVAGKPTLTLPHVEVGDFIEVEHITSQAGDGARGRQYQSPQWFFREADKGYWQSEFVVVTPTDRQLDIESRGNVPAPDLLPIGTFVEHRWRVDLSPPAEIEPDGPPITEFLPSVRVGWGVALDATASRLVDLVGDPTPIDPRLRALEQQIVAGTSPGASDERARRLYRWVLDHVQDGKETDGRRVLTGRSGARQAAFRYLLRMAGIDCELALVKSRLAMPPLGPMSEIEQYEALVMRLTTDRGLRWMTVRDKFAPFGYVPAEWRDQTAIRLVAGTPRDVVRAPAAADRVAYEGRADVHDDGSAVLDLTLTFDGNRAIAWRTALDQVPQSKINEFVEREVIAPSFDGAHVNDLKALGASDLDKPLVLHVRVDVPELAKRVPGGLAVHPPFAPPLAQLAALPARRTALLRRTSWRAEIRVRVVMPESTTLPPGLPHAERRDGDAFVVVNDTVRGHAIEFDRVIDMPSGRVQPGDEYTRWQTFVQSADALVTRDVLVGK
jgi:tetratricopeptide (TPR) repeat protein